MDNQNFLYKIYGEPIKCRQSEMVPGCFYYEWILDWETIFIPDGRMHFIRMKRELQQLMVSQYARTYPRRIARMFGIGLGYGYVSDQDLYVVNDFFDCVLIRKTFEERCEFCEQNLIPIFNPHKVHPLVEQVVLQMQESDGKASVGQIASELQYSARQIQHAFKEQYGYGPKQYAQIMRLRKVVSRMQEDRTLTLAQIAKEEGYSHASHLQRDFKRFIGMTPQELRCQYL